MDPDTAKLFAGAIAMLPALGAALGLGMYTSSYSQGVARNPQAKDLLDKNFFLILAFIEALGIIPIGIGAALLFG
ncbi:F0F1 ATP synthase subunit C [Alphaproteobacteria bacterium]|nr:F0F1 ATP synthase subunit C [Alphaproteobacteria bacterium]